MSGSCMRISWRIHFWESNAFHDFGACWDGLRKDMFHETHFRDWCCWQCCAIPAAFPAGAGDVALPVVFFIFISSGDVGRMDEALNFLMAFVSGVAVPVLWSVLLNLLLLLTFRLMMMLKKWCDN